MSVAISAEVAEQRAREMAALNPAERNVLVALGILSGVVLDARRRFERRVTICDIAAEWPSPPRCA